MRIPTTGLPSSSSAIGDSLPRIRECSLIAKHGTFELALKSESLACLESTGINGTLSIAAPPGAYRLRAVAQEALTGKTAASSQPVQIQ